MLSLLLVSSLQLTCFALNADETYSDLTSTSSQVTNLINYANNYETFIDSKYVCYRAGQNDYFIVWGDLNYNGSVVTSDSEIEYIRYFRSSNTSEWKYQYDTDSSFSLKSSFINTSNIDTYGFSSSVFSAYYNEHVIRYLLIFILAILFAKFVTARGSHV